MKIETSGFIRYTVGYNGIQAFIVIENTHFLNVRILYKYKYAKNQYKFTSSKLWYITYECRPKFNVLWVQDILSSNRIFSDMNKWIFLVLVNSVVRLYQIKFFITFRMNKIIYLSFLGIKGLNIMKKVNIFSLKTFLPLSLNNLIFSWFLMIHFPIP